MNRISLRCWTTTIVVLAAVPLSVAAQPAILVDEIGYTPLAEKVALMRGTSETVFQVVNAANGRIVWAGAIRRVGLNDAASGDQVFDMDFSALRDTGTYFIRLPGADLSSCQFRIAPDVYASVVKTTAESFSFQRCGTTTGEGTPWRHSPCHGEDAVSFDDPRVRRDVTGGWHDAGDYGKFVVTGALSAAFLLYAVDEKPDNFTDGQFKIPERQNGIPDVLDEVRWEIDWLLKMQNQDGGVCHKVSTKKWTGEYLPQRDPDQRFLFPVSTAATASFAAVTALAARVFDPWDKPYSARLLRASLLAWKFLEDHPGIMPAGGFHNPPGVEGGEYGDGKDSDERLWASVELYRVTRNQRFHSFFLDHSMETDAFGSPISWQNVQNFAFASYLRIPRELQNPKVVSSIKFSLLSYANALMKRIHDSGYRCILLRNEFYWGSNSVVLGYAFNLIQAARETNQAEYSEAALDQLHYILGRNAFNQTFVTGLGVNPARHPYHQLSMMLRVNEPVPGLVVGGPNSNSRLRGRVISEFPAKCYEDSEKNYYVNEVAINYTAPLTYVASYFTDLQDLSVIKKQPAFSDR